MLRVSKLADYATVVLAYMAKNIALFYNARDIALHTHIALPTVSKILKLLARSKLLNSQRGIKGGYQLIRDPKQISVAEILCAIDGDFGMTDCSHFSGLCALESLCAIRNNWQLISQAIYQELKFISLADIAKPMSANNFQIKTLQRTKFVE